MEPTVKPALIARNKSKRRYQIYQYEEIMEDCQNISEEVIGKRSHSEFAFLCTLYVLGKMKKKYKCLNEKDRMKFRKLGRCMTA